MVELRERRGRKRWGGEWAVLKGKSSSLVKVPTPGGGEGLNKCVYLVGELIA